MALTLRWQSKLRLVMT